MGASGRQFGIRYGLSRPLLTVLGLGPAFSGISLDDSNLRVKMAWGFRATVPLASIRSVSLPGNRWAGVGVHGWRGWWLVNGSVTGIVRIEIDPPALARVMGVPVKLRILDVSASDPDALVAALKAARSRS